MQKEGESSMRLQRGAELGYAVGSTSSAAPAGYFGREDTFEVIPGTPAAIAELACNPKPSYNDG